jgi:hypothetical protein
MAFIKVIEKIIKPKENLKRAKLPAFICNGGYFLTDLTIYEDGDVDCWGIVSFEEFLQKVEQGWVTVELPQSDNLEISIHGLGEISPGYNYQTYKNNADLIAEVRDILSELNGLPDSSEICRAAWKDYQQEPTEEKRLALRQAYEAIPTHNRRYALRDQDRKDYPVRRIIYPNDDYSFGELIFASDHGEVIQQSVAELSNQVINSMSQENDMANTLQQNINEVVSIKKQYEDEIKDFINQKLNEFQQQVNLPINYLDLDIDTEHEDENYLTTVSNLKIQILLEL